MGSISLESCFLFDLQASQAEAVIIIKSADNQDPSWISAAQTLGKLRRGGWESLLSLS